MDTRRKLTDFNEMEQEILKVYWSDHCRHTTFNTHITDIEIDGTNPAFKKQIKNSLKAYGKQRKFAHGKKLKQKPITLMDLATIGGRYQKAKGGMLDVVDDKIEYNAATVKTNINGKNYRISFKNETHNSPTEVNPYDGAATCLGGAVRDIIAARAYPYQAMRVTGCADPVNSPVIPGKLTQKEITTMAAKGFSDFGQGLGLTAGHIREIYHPGYQAKRMEAGHIVGVVQADWARIEEPVKGDMVILLGGKTGRDGVGSAVASSKTQNEKSIKTEGESVPKGDSDLGRKNVNLYRSAEFLKIVKKCNDFGAGGVSVAIGEIADGLDIYLDKVPLNVKTLKPYEIAISESQERMAVVISPSDWKTLQKIAAEYGVSATAVAEVTDTGYMNMFYKGEKVASFERNFLNSAGEARIQNISIKAPNMSENPFIGEKYGSFKEMVTETMNSLENCSQQALAKQFTQTNEFTVLKPYDGKKEKTPTQGSVMLVPVPENKTKVTIAAHGYDPYVAKWSPFYGGQTARLDSMAKILALGGDYKTTYLSDQEYYASPINPEKFGHPFAALLGANDVSRAFDNGPIGGKDSMSGTYKDIEVPPTFISFALGTADLKTVSSQAFKKEGSAVGILSAAGEDGFPLDFSFIRKKWDYFLAQRNAGNVLTARVIGAGGIIAEICNAAVGNEIGFQFNSSINRDSLNNKSYGSLLVEWKDGVKLDKSMVQIIGQTTAEKEIKLGEEKVTLKEVLKASEERLEPVFEAASAKAAPASKTAAKSAKK